MQVTKQEFDKFISLNKGKLTTSTITICEPPQLGYYNFIDYEGWDALVASSCNVIDSEYNRTGEIKYMISDRVALVGGKL